MKSPSLRKAIDNFCKGCTYVSQVLGTWRQQIAACTLKNCEMHHVRHVDQKIKGRKNRTYLTIEILNDQGIKLEDLDDRARSIVINAPES